MIINDEIKSLIPPLTETEYSLLEQSILEEGCRDALITWNGTLLDGHNRYEICTKHNIEFYTIEKDFENKEDAMDWMDKNQLGRRNLTPDQRQIIIGRRYNREKKTPETQNRGNRFTVKVEGGQTVPPLKTADAIAREAGVSDRTVKRYAKSAEFYSELEKSEPELATKIWSGETTLKEVMATKKKQERIEDIEQQLEAIERGELPELEGLFDVVSIDPPWAYEERGGASSAEYDASSVRGTVTYPTMTLSELEQLNLPVKDDAVLFLWTTHAFLRDAFDLLETWGFDYKATIVWDKEKMGIGRNIRLQCEFCLLATKGSPYLNGGSVRDIIREPRREHSRKPEAFYELVETLTLGRKLDYFAREQREGWETYGNETDKF